MWRYIVGALIGVVVLSKIGGGISLFGERRSTRQGRVGRIVLTGETCAFPGFPAHPPVLCATGIVETVGGLGFTTGDLLIVDTRLAAQDVADAVLRDLEQAGYKVAEVT